MKMLEKLSTRYDHGAGGLRLFDADPSIFSEHLSDSHVWRPLVCAVVGHHGEPPNPTFDSLVGLRPDFGKAGLDAARSFVAEDSRAVQRAPGSRASRRGTSFPGIFPFGGIGCAGGLDRLQSGLVPLSRASR